MLIPFNKLSISKPIKGVIHIGAHECEERIPYINNFHITDSQIIWIDALVEKVYLIKTIHPNVQIYNECISDEDDKDVSFMVTNNYQSSSILNLKTHLYHHPWVFEVGRRQLKTKTLNTFFKKNNLTPSNYNFLNLDIQGAELLALKGATDILPHIDYIYCEVNIEELYENCALLPVLEEFLKEQGFKLDVIQMTDSGWGDAFFIRIN